LIFSIKFRQNICVWKSRFINPNRNWWRQF